jgi:hypothetical protein
MKQNLNDLKVEDKDSQGYDETYSLNSNPGLNAPVEAKIQPIFRDIDKFLIDKINQYPVVVGCVAWLTHTSILKALALKESVSLIIQREDFLRPDYRNRMSKDKLRSLYEALPAGPTGSGSGVYWGDLISILNYNWCWSSAPVRWLGEPSSSRTKTKPKMHNKFLVFCNKNKSDDDPNYDDSYYLEDIEPIACWTGSFNFTYNGCLSLENGLFIIESEVVQAYYDEWQRIFALSETIPGYAWNLEWYEPEEFAIGT